MAVFLCAMAANLAGAQTAPAQQSIEARLRGPVLMLRGLYNGSRLDFNADGRLKNLAGIMPFSLSAIQVENVRLTDSRLEIDGVREGLKFTQPAQPDENVQISAAAWDPREQVRILVARDRHRPEALDQALAAIFSSGFDDALATAAPDFWRPWLHHNLHPDDPSDQLHAALDEDGSNSCSQPGLTPPQLMQAPSPQFSIPAQMTHDQGTVTVHLTVEPDGQTQRLFLVRPLGMGLDEQAIAAVRRYRFNPGTVNGTPVSCEMNVEVSFRRGQP